MELISDAYLLEIKINTENSKGALAELHGRYSELEGFSSKSYDDGTLRLWGFGVERDESPARIHRQIAECLHECDPSTKVTTRWRWVRWEHEFTTRGKAVRTAEAEFDGRSFAAPEDSSY